VSRMKCSGTFSLLSTAGLTALAICTVVPGASAQGTPPPPLNFQLPTGYQIPPSDQQCILKGERLNLQCIIANDPDAKRIRAEEAMLEAKALAAANSGKLDPYHQIQTLGELEIFDPNLSVNSNIACSYCHDPMAGYANGVSILSVFTGGSNPGSVPITVSGAYPNNRIAKRNPQSYTYATYYPPLHYNQSQADFYGGNFWDGRASGYRLQNSSAHQAQGPPLDTQEMANPDSACVVWKLSQSAYKSFFETVWGANSLEIAWPSNVATICSTPAGAASLGGNTTPVQLSTSDRTLSNKDFDEFAQAIASYEGSDSVSPFTSKFDYYLAGNATLTTQEQNGYDLFRGKGSCNTCHLDGRSSTLLGGSDTGQAASVQPLFTDTTYNNLGLPKNVTLPWYSEDTPDQWGFTANPLGFGFTDLGMGLFLDGYYGAPPDLSWGVLEPKFDGKFQTSTARNAAQVPYAGFVKAYMHNGYLTSLKEVVHFYNTRDVYPYNVLSGHCPEGTVEKVTCWPMPEDANNENTVIGKLGLTPEEEDDIVAFLGTLVDSYKP
jgi:cytochrome c peroxidase